jgi:hypothetical protein
LKLKTTTSTRLKTKHANIIKSHTDLETNFSNTFSNLLFRKGKSVERAFSTLSNTVLVAGLPRRWGMAEIAAFF